MSDYIPKPTVETVCHHKKYDFTLIVLAYRRVTPDEAHRTYLQYLHENKLKHPPRGITARCETLYGFDLESGL